MKKTERNLKVLEYVKKAYSDEKFFTSKRFWERINNLVKMVTNRYRKSDKYFPIKVNLSWDSENDMTACTNNNMLFINMNHALLQGLDKKQRLTAIWGLLAHELGHCLYTDFILGAKFLRGDWDFKSHLSKDTYTFFEKHNIVSINILKELQNILEDPFIEYAISSVYTGSFKRGIIYIRSILQEKLKERILTGRYDFMTLILAQARLCLPEELLEIYPCLKDTQKIFDRLYLNPSPTMEDRLNLTLKLFDCIFETFIKDLFDDKTDEEIHKKIEQMKEQNKDTNTDKNEQQRSGGMAVPQQQQSSSSDDRSSSSTSKKSSQTQGGSDTDEEENLDSDSSGNSSDDTDDDENDDNSFGDFSNGDTSDNEDFEDDSKSEESAESNDQEDEDGNNSSDSNSSTNETKEDDFEEENGNEGEGSSSDTDDFEESNDENGSSDDMIDESSDEENKEGTSQDGQNEKAGDDKTDNEDGECDTESTELSSSETEDNTSETSEMSKNGEFANQSKQNIPESEINNDELSPSVSEPDDDLDENDFEANDIGDIDNVLESVAKSLIEEDDVQREYTNYEIEQEILSTSWHHGVNQSVTKITGGSKELYKTYFTKANIAKISKSAQNKVRDAVLQKKRNLTNRRQPKGSRIDINAYCRRKNDDDFNVFINSTQASKNPLMAISAVLDHSGSMKINKKEKILLGMFASMIMEDFSRNLKIPFSLITHTESSYSRVRRSEATVKIHEYVSFDGNKGEKYALTKIPDDSAMFYRNRDGFAIRYAVNQIKSRKEPFKVVIIISDGLPNGTDYGFHDALADIADIKKECKKKHIELIAFAIDGNIDALKQLYGEENLVDCRDLQKFPKELSRVLAEKSAKAYK